MATTAPPQTAPEQPADTRGPTAPLPATVFGSAPRLLGAALVGTAIVQVVRGRGRRPLTPECIAEGLTHYDPATQKGIKGAEGVCHIVTGLRSGPRRRPGWPSPSACVRRSSSGSRRTGGWTRVASAEHAI